MIVALNGAPAVVTGCGRRSYVWGHGSLVARTEICSMWRRTGEPLYDLSIGTRFALLKPSVLSKALDISSRCERLVQHAVHIIAASVGPPYSTLHPCLERYNPHGYHVLIDNPTRQVWSQRRWS